MDHIPEGVQIQVDPVGPQISEGRIYPGRGSQIQILNYGNKVKITPVGEPIEITSKKCGV
ncbi:hypothetical protein EXT68_22505 [Pectobacterium parmentieri]|uniref:Uncharacterized protein n=1 Tax=Pectobacterium parmentieri TaxID=1905730 RepID=A0A0H3HYQ0_PECPM|nr:hypothetical protein [Pectobacterium parmentieri]AFI88303.1 Hypothetical protein W5S_0164 [Pectobacterium parmentieri]MBI0472632.1 hypothetical protein [Pectobacterium parmentieri]MBI0495311.1 hypothetical protein [Pectobacterium parmentieri]MBI0556567.1 hypothetical protein [Pectobacterium parmentieri]MBI0569738.1 hypothetical protein [Pectobacterium parmentieri]